MDLDQPVSKNLLLPEKTNNVWTREGHPDHVREINTLMYEPMTSWNTTEVDEAKNVQVAFHNASVYQKERVTISNHLIALFRHNVSRGESAVRPGSFLPFTFLPETMNVYSAGPMPACRSFTDMTMIVCGMNPGFMFEVGKEVDARSVTDFRRIINLRDKSLEHIIMLLAAEVESGGYGGRLYWDDLSHALALRTLKLAGDIRTTTSHHQMWSQRVLRRILDKMDAELTTDLDLSTLAAESGYSKSHFLRMFQSAMGCAPHQWLIRSRIERAKKLLRESSQSIIDIAAACGFSSHSHLSRTFHKIVGVAPSQYRRVGGIHNRRNHSVRQTN
jgi:AraC family transcriptional regulator